MTQSLEIVPLTIHGHVHLVLRATVGGLVRHFSLNEITEDGEAVAWFKATKPLPTAGPQSGQIATLENLHAAGYIDDDLTAGE